VEVPGSCSSDDDTEEGTSQSNQGATRVRADSEGSSVEGDTAAPVVILADEDVSEEELVVSNTEQAGLSDWLDQLETKAGIKDDELSSSHEPQIDPSHSKSKKSSSKSSAIENPEEEVKKKKKKKKDKDESGTKKKKEKSSRDKDGSKKEKPDKGGGESGKKEKKKKKKKESAVEDEGRNELEAFLNDGGGYESL
uniref:Uncharacterized protein n=1 Tax=Magallana gigas TaxID=29159 RepID=A0A8W8LIH5_MAGGI